MHNKSHRYTNMEQFKDHVKSKLRLDDTEFEVILTEQNEDERFEESHISYLREEDENIQALQVCSSKCFRNFVPCKNETERVNEFEGIELMKMVNDKPEFYCKTHPEKKANFICLNKSCDYIFFCMMCRKKHERTCSRKLMVMNIEQIKNKDFINDYFDESEVDFDESIKKVQNKIKKKREKMNEMFNVLEKTLVNKLKLQSKEFKLKQMREFILDKHKDYKGRKSN